MSALCGAFVYVDLSFRKYVTNWIKQKTLVSTMSMRVHSDVLRAAVYKTHGTEHCTARKWRLNACHYSSLSRKYENAKQLAAYFDGFYFRRQVLRIFIQYAINLIGCRYFHSSAPMSHDINAYATNTQNENTLQKKTGIKTWNIVKVNSAFFRWSVSLSRCVLFLLPELVQFVWKTKWRFAYCNGAVHFGLDNWITYCALIKLLRTW